MHKELTKILTNIDKEKENFVKGVIKYVWEEEPEDYIIEIDGDYVYLGDFYNSFQDFINIGKYNISKSIVYEYWDMTHLNFETERIKEFKNLYKNICNTNLVMWYYYCNKDNELIEEEENTEKSYNIIYK